MSNTGYKAFPYEEPHTTTILTTASFIYLLNMVHHLLDTTLHCGLVGQILIGIIYGTPLGNILSHPLQQSIVELGYIGLILLVYHGGLNTSLKPLLSDLPLSLLTALTGLILPIALSYLLIPLTNATPIQCFAAGAALSATSLGTTFSILTAAQLTVTRLGVVLTSAAMIDDVIGLVMIQIVASLGTSSASSTGAVVGRGLGATVGLVVVAIIGAVLLRKLSTCTLPRQWMQKSGIALLLHTIIVLGFVSIAGYAGASVLFAAFLAGFIITWGLDNDDHQGKWVTGIDVYELYLSKLADWLLLPFFFASIGFSIPITSMFRGSTVWRGIVYSVLMTVGKMATGIWLLFVRGRLLLAMPKDSLQGVEEHSSEVELELELQTTPPSPSTTPPPALPPPPHHLLPATIFGLAMVARGEIAFLIASVAERRGVFAGNDDIYLVIVWAAVVCTVLGPVVVGWLVRRV
ncbi:hypothetical protein HDV00_009197 [Rhizophlyctis rosea]|nr:hypothetical protein HDV00_009197 [Rhizophlyctis rosea]